MWKKSKRNYEEQKQFSKYCFILLTVYLFLWRPVLSPEYVLMKIFTVIFSKLQKLIFQNFLYMKEMRKDAYIIHILW